jgi:phage shock protein PspC (stress-responsive transcriptional regulator)
MAFDDHLEHRGERPELRRAGEGRMIAGVCAGLADHLDVDVVLVRIAVVVLAVVAGIGVPLYLAAWLLVPEEGTDESIADRLLADRLLDDRVHDGWRGRCCCTPGAHGGRGGSEHAQAS